MPPELPELLVLPEPQVLPEPVVPPELLVLPEPQVLLEPRVACWCCWCLRVRRRRRNDETGDGKQRDDGEERFKIEQHRDGLPVRYESDVSQFFWIDFFQDENDLLERKLV